MTVFRVPINLSWPGAGSPGVNVFSIRTETFTGDDDANLQQAVDALHTFYAGFAGYLAPGVKVSLGEVVERTEQTRKSPTFAQITSSANPSSAPQALQVVIGWRTSLAARRGMGRTFIGPLASTAMESDGSISPNALAAIGDNAQILVTASQSGTNGWALGVWGCAAKPEKGTTDYASLPHVHRDVIGWKIRDQFSILRSRRD